MFAKSAPTRVEVAHELAHYVQNHPVPGASPATALQARSEVSAPADAAEQEAESVARRVVAGEQVEVRARPTAGIHRMLVGWELETNVPIYQHGQRDDHLDGYAAQATEYAHENVDEGLRHPLGAGFEIHVDSSQTAYRSALNLLNPNATMHTVEIVAKPVSTRGDLAEKMRAVHAYLSWFTDHREFSGNHFSIGWPEAQADVSVTTPGQQDPNSDAPPPAVTTVHPRATVNTRMAQDLQQTRAVRLFEVNTQLTFQAPPDSLKTIADLDVRPMRVDKKPVEYAMVDRERMSFALKVAPTSALATRALDVAVKIFKDAVNFLTKLQAGTVKNSVLYLIRSDLDKLFVDLDPVPRYELAAELRSRIRGLSPKHLGIEPALAKELFTPKMDGILIKPAKYHLMRDPQGREAGELEHIDSELQHLVREDVFDNGRYLVFPWDSFAFWFAKQVYEAVRPQLLSKQVVTGPLHGSKNLGILPEPEQDAPQPAVVFEGRTPVSVVVTDGNLPNAIHEELDRVGFP